MKRILRRIITGAIAIVVASTVGVAVHATPATDSLRIELAANTTRTITITSEVRIRPTPDTSQQWLTTMPAGANPWYICYVDGQNVQGTTKWFHITWNGYDGYYSSVADDVPMSLQGNIEGNYGIPRCGTGADINQGSQKNATVSPAPTIYDRRAAVRWATQNAQAWRPDRFADCTWFVSQALWAGGFHQTAAWNRYDHHGFPLWPIEGTVAATAAPDLVDYLLTNGLAEKIPLDDNFATNAVPEARVGDVIAYTWDPVASSNIDHLAFIVNIAPGDYPEVAEWGTTPVHSPYAKRGWTWSALSNTWLQDPRSHPHVTAVLIRFTVHSY